MAQRIRPNAANARIFVLLGNNILLAAWLDIRQLQLFAKNLGQLFERDIHLDHMLAWLRAGLALARLRVAAAPNRFANIAIALADAAALLCAIAKLRQIDLRHRDRDVLAPLPTDHLALRHILAQVFFNFAPHDLPEAIQIALDASDGHSVAFGRIQESGVRSQNSIACIATALHFMAFSAS